MYRSTSRHSLSPNSSLLELKQSPDRVTSSASSSIKSSIQAPFEMSSLSLSKTVSTGAFVLMGIHARSYKSESMIHACPQGESPAVLVGATSSTSRAYLCALAATVLMFLALVCWIKANDAWKRIIWPFSGSSLSQSSKGISCHALSGLSKVTSVDTFKNLSKNFFHSLDSCSLRAAIHAITRKECFVRSDYIERLSINDFAVLYRYASDLNLVDFDKAKFLSEQTQIVRSVITAMDMAVKVSRGCLVEASTIEEWKRSEGDVDALYFVAVTRIFAEWRTLRLVPQGYQRYAVGLSLAYRDVLQNLEKIERGVHAYHQDQQKQQHNSSRIPSPTLKQLLQYEIDTKLHKNLPKLQEKSSASGLLWTKRQLHYQVATFNNSLEVPACYPSAKEAAKAAYLIVYDEYHGWAVKQIFSHSFGGSPPLDAIWLSLDPPKDMPKNSKQTKTGTEAAPSSFGDQPERTLSDVSSDVQNSGEEDNQFLLALENMNRGIAEKWEDMLRMFNCGKEEKNKKESLVLSSESHFNLSALVSDNSIHSSSSIAPQQHRFVQTSDPIERSKRDAEDFVHAVSPMIADLGVMIDALNMNDPSRV